MFVDENIEGFQDWESVLVSRNIEVKGADQRFFPQDNSCFVTIKDAALPKLDGAAIKLISEHFNNSELIKGAERVFLFFSNCRLGKVDISMTGWFVELENCLLAEDVSIAMAKDIKMVSCSVESNFELRSSGEQYPQLDLEDVVFKGKVSFHNKVFKGSNDDELRLNTRLYNVVFEDSLLLDKVVFTSDVEMNSVIWPKQIAATRDIFRQLKRIMANQQDFIQSSIFHSYEMLEYQKELSKKSWKSNFEDKVLFSVNKYVSNFSLSWLRPFLWIVGVSLVFYAVAWCIQPLSSSFNGFFEFLNPFSWSAKKQFEGIYWLWFLHKLMVVPLVYLMVVALKRKTKL